MSQYDPNLRVIHVDDLKMLLISAAEEGAKKALASVGLDDHDAAKDIAAARDLLGMWRTAKTAAWQTAVKIIVTGAFAVAIAGTAVKLKLFGSN